MHFELSMFLLHNKKMTTSSLDERPHTTCRMHVPFFSDCDFSSGQRGSHRLEELPSTKACRLARGYWRLQSQPASVYYTQMPGRPHHHRLQLELQERNSRRAGRLCPVSLRRLATPPPRPITIIVYLFSLLYYPTTVDVHCTSMCTITVMITYSLLPPICEGKIDYWILLVTCRCSTSTTQHLWTFYLHQRWRIAITNFCILIFILGGNIVHLFQL